MDLKLPLLADANLHLSIAEEAVAEEAWQTATHEIEKAEEALEELRLLWPELKNNEKGLLSSLAKPLSKKASSLKKKIPAMQVISKAQMVEDPEQEIEPN